MNVRPTPCPEARPLLRCFGKGPSYRQQRQALKGPFAGAFRYRVGDHRVVYTIDDDLVRVSVITIAKRRDVYE